MKCFEGVIATLGPSVTATSSAAVTATQYTYIEIGGKVIRKVVVYHGLTGPLELALKSGAPVSVYTKHGHICAIRLGDGKTYGTDMGMGYLLPSFFFLFFMSFVCLLGYFTASLMLPDTTVSHLVRQFLRQPSSAAPLLLPIAVGALLAMPAWHFWKVLAIKRAARGLPNVIVV